MDIIDIYRIFYPNIKEYTFYSREYGRFSKNNHILGQNINLYKFKRIETTLCSLSDQNAIKLKMDSKTKQNLLIMYKLMNIKQPITDDE